MEYTINKGIGKSVEFKGLSSQYLFVFAGGLLAVFVLFVILYMIGIDQWVCIGFGVIAASMLVWLTFHLNAKYGQHGLMKLGAYLTVIVMGDPDHFFIECKAFFVKK